ncbi:MAG: NAD-dependent epimerase/dehydratase family protein [Verrucomicrobiales bacterium]|nr:NAD-dependent epimerase/dehydratase family protein [Verrucomicrobiales bacterium]
MIVIAGSGFVGIRLAAQLHRAGHSVATLTRGQDSAAALAAAHPWPVFACDITEPAAVGALATRLSTPVSVIIHCASSGRGGAQAYQSVFVDGMRHLLQAFPHAFPIFTSSTSVYAQTDGSTVTEQSPTEPDRDTGRLLLTAEKIALDAGGAALRLAGLYGPSRYHVLLSLLTGRAAIEDPPDQHGSPGRILNQIHAADAAHALFTLALQRQPGLFNAADDHPRSQEEGLNELADLFSQPPPGHRPADPTRKRGWTSKAVSNTRLRSLGWCPCYPDPVTALRRDPALAASILDQANATTDHPPPLRAPNILLIGLMGSGKTTVGRIIAQKLGWDFVDTDALLVSQAQGRSIPDIFASEGESGFRDRESATLLSLLGTRNTVIATGGGIILRPENRSLLHHLGFIIWLEADPARLAYRTSFNQDRPLLHTDDPLAKLTLLLDQRGPLYRSLADLRIKTEDLNPEESAYGATESARVFFMQQIRHRAAWQPPTSP